MRIRGARRLSLLAAGTVMAGGGMLFGAGSASANVDQGVTTSLKNSACQDNSLGTGISTHGGDNYTIDYSLISFSDSGGCGGSHARARLGCFNADGSPRYISDWIGFYGRDINVSASHSDNLPPGGFCQVDGQLAPYGDPDNWNVPFVQTRIYQDGGVQRFVNGQPI